MNEFVITSRQGAKCVFHSRTYEPGGRLESYTVEMEDLDFQASMQVFNAGYDLPPSALFGRLASQWTGWKGSEEWRSAEGEFAIVATCDRTGHVRFAFNFLKPAQSAYWSASAFVLVEAGQLDSIAWEAHAFFHTDLQPVPGLSK